MPDSITHTVILMPLGASFSAPEGASLLQALEAAGLDMPSSCRNGTCRTCICRVRTGEVRHLIEWPGLSFDEKREGYILPCVAAARGDVVLEAPLARRVVFD
jgi:ferredoxin